MDNITHRSSLAGGGVHYIQKWVNFRSAPTQLLQLQAKLPLRDDPGQLLVSLRELEEEHRKLKIMMAGMEEHRAGVELDNLQENMEQIGKDPYAIVRKSGTAKPKSPASARETDDVNNYSSVRKRKK